MDDCIFCRIIAGKLPCQKVYEDDAVLAIRDIKPAAPIHVLVVLKEHVASAVDPALTTRQLESMFGAVSKTAAILGVTESGFRLVTNIGEDGGQSIRHLHFHLLAGKLFGADFG